MSSLLSYNCVNCLSQKRQFYVYLSCDHFICLLCTLCLTNFQTFKIRCCHIYTQMSDQLIDVVMKQVKKRKIQKQYQNEQKQQNSRDQFNNKQRQQYKNKQKQINNKYDQNSQIRKTNNQSRYNRVQQQCEQQLICNKVKKIDKQLNNTSSSFNIIQIKNKQQQSTIKQSKYKPSQQDKYILIDQIVQSQIENNSGNNYDNQQFNNNKNNQSYNHNHKRYESSGDINTNGYKQCKQNYVCWKNHQSSKDRILAKLNYHQHKINTLIKTHFY